MNNLKFKVCITGRNCGNLIKRCLSSIKEQTYKNFDLIGVDDDSSDHTYEEMSLYQGPNWSFIKNPERIGALNNIVNIINLHNCSDDDVIVLIDADDWLFTQNAFEVLARYYESGAKATYGSRALISKDATIIDIPKSEELIRYNWRENRKNLVHLHTFKYEVYKNIIHSKSFIDEETGKYYMSAHDRVIMTNIAELAGTKIKRVPECLYAYNNENPLSDFNVARPEQKRIDMIVKDRQASYKPFF